MTDTLLEQFFVADEQFFVTSGNERRRWAIVCDTLGGML